MPLLPHFPRALFLRGLSHENVNFGGHVGALDQPLPVDSIQKSLIVPVEGIEPHARKSHAPTQVAAGLGVEVFHFVPYNQQVFAIFLLHGEAMNRGRRILNGKKDKLGIKTSAPIPA